MRVYVVTETTVNGETSDEYTSVARVFSTEEKAKAYVDSFGNSSYYYAEYDWFEVE